MGIFIRCTLKHACTRSRRHAPLLLLGGDYCRKPKSVRRKSCSADLKRRACTQGKVWGGDQQPHQHSCTENSSQMHQHDSSVLLSEWKALLVHSAGWGLVKCSRTAAWRVPLPLINNSDNMIYATHFAHKITGCNCLPDVFGACCSFLSASW